MAILKTAGEIEAMAEGGRRLAGILRELAESARAGAVPSELDAQAKRLIEAAHAEPAFLGYRPHGARRPYPASICVSVNEVVVHGIPGADPLKDGDTVKIDIGLIYKGLYVDAAATVGIGKVAPAALKLMEATRVALDEAVKKAVAGNTVGDIGFAVRRCVESRGFSVVEGLTGHGVGRELHEEPAVPNFGREGEGEELLEGMVLAIEPMTAAGSGKLREGPDGEFATKDGSVSAHFEHTVAITKEGPRVLTAP